MQFEQTLVLFRSNNLQTHVTRESLEIALLKESLNQEECVKLSTSWLPPYETLQGETDSIEAEFSDIRTKGRIN